MKKIMIIGTGDGQLPIILESKKKGIFTIGIDSNPFSVGATLVDKFYKISTTDSESALKIAKEEKIDAVVTLQSDAPVITVGKINSEMRLTGVSYETAIICNNKNLTRDKLSDTVLQPKSIAVKNVYDAYSAFHTINAPCIVKPSDSSGSRGVSLVTTEYTLLNAYNSAIEHSKSNTVIVEQFIEGIEIGAQTLSQNGKCIYCFIHNDAISNNEFMVPVGHSYPLKNPKLNQRLITDTIIKALDKINLKDGPANIDLIIDKYGNPYIIEIGARVGATCLPELTSIYSGLNWVGLVIDNALGKPHETKKILGTACAAYILESKTEGRLLKIDVGNSQSKYNDCSIKIDITAKLGDNIRPLKNGTDRIGSVIVEANTVERAILVASKVKDDINFITE